MNIVGVLIILSAISVICYFIIKRIKDNRKYRVVSKLTGYIFFQTNSEEIADKMVIIYSNQYPYDLIDKEWN
jgi:hypothetical protein